MTPAALYALIEATWPPVSRSRTGPWTIRPGGGGGQRVSCATAEAPAGPPEIAEMEAAMAALGQRPLVMVRAGEAALDAALAAAGYEVVDPVVAYAAPVAALAGPLAPATAIAHWPRLAKAEEIWAECGLGPDRLAVMDRSAAPKATIIARTDDAPAGVAFVALHDGAAMLHALEVLPRFRRRGTGRNILTAAARWAGAAGAHTLALAVTAANGPARALYASLGMQPVGQYHYRRKQREEAPRR